VCVCVCVRVCVCVGGWVGGVGGGVAPTLELGYNPLFGVQLGQVTGALCA